MHRKTAAVDERYMGTVDLHTRDAFSQKSMHRMHVKLLALRQLEESL